MVLEIAEIQSRLDEQFVPLEPMLTGLRLVSSKITQEDIDRLQQQLDVILPKHFQGLLRRFDFGCFTLGSIAFCNSGDFLSWAYENNRGDSVNAYPWWGSGPRPDNLLLIANSDPYAVLLNCNEDTISVFKHGEAWSEHKIVVANDFELFIRGLGTVFLMRSPEGGNLLLADEVSIEVGGGKRNSFWQWFAE